MCSVTSGSKYRHKIHPIAAGAITLLLSFDCTADAHITNRVAVL